MSLIFYLLCKTSQCPLDSSRDPLWDCFRIKDYCNIIRLEKAQRREVQGEEIDLEQMVP